MSDEWVILNAKRREATEDAIREVCAHRQWRLRAINVRTNRVHVVVSTGGRKPEGVLNAHKAYSTRKMRESACWISDRSPWVDKGSEKWLWNEQSVANACDYLANGQGCDLTQFDNWRK